MKLGKKITGAEFPLADIFSSKFTYNIPPYQRPYAWTVEETGTLFDDLYDFYINESDDNYFLGSIVLIKEDDKPKAAVIDGQQRLTTLTILLAVVASKLSGADKEDYKYYLQEPGRKSQGLAPSPRVSLRQKDQVFFEKYVQNICIKELLSLDNASFENEAQFNIANNCNRLLNKLESVFATEKEVMDFGEFLMQRCFLVAVYTPSQQSAFRVFSVMNNRGLDLLPIDIIKADILGKIPANKQQDYTETWEELEILTGRNAFNDLFGHVRMLYAKAKAKRTLLEEFKEYVISKEKPEDFVDHVLIPFTEAYSDIRGKSYVATKNSQKINELLSWLNKINNSDWIPPAILFLSIKKDDPDFVLWFFTKLERLAAYLHATSKDVNFRIERYAQIIKEIQSDANLSINTPLLAVELTDDEKKEFSKVLDSDIYRLTAIRRNYLILRLDSFVADGAATYEPSVLTIEHVLPQTVNNPSEWNTLWPDASKREVWLHKIANLVPLTKRHNSAAHNYDFNEKKSKYFISKNGTSSYALTTQVLHISSWTEEVVKKRQHELLNIFKVNWEL